MPLSSKCSLCVRDLHATERLGKLPCLHVFHFNCVYINLLRALECPECKKAVPDLSHIEKLSVNSKMDKAIGNGIRLLKTELEQSLKIAGDNSKQTVDTQSKVSAQFNTNSNKMSELQELRHECNQNFEFLKQVNAQLEFNCRQSHDLQNRLNNAEKTAETTNELKIQFIKMPQEMTELQKRMFLMEKLVNEQKQQANEVNETNKSSTFVAMSISDAQRTQHMTHAQHMALLTAATHYAPTIANKTLNESTNDKDFSDASKSAIALKNRIIKDLEHKLSETTLELGKEIQKSKILSAQYEKLQKYLIESNMPDAVSALLKEKHNVWSACIPNDGVAAAVLAGALADAQCVKNDKFNK